MTNLSSVIPKQVVACIGSNMPDADMRILGAIEFLRKLGKVGSLDASPVYHCGDSAYGNAVARFCPLFPLSELIERSKSYERACGRTPEGKERGEVVIDIDFVLADGQVLRGDYFAPYFSEGLRLLGE